MWFGKDIMTKLGLVLAMAVPALAADVAPLTFSGVSDPVTMQKYWDELMSFKMWGTSSIDFHSAELTDVVGAIGTTGDMTLGNARQYLGGPIYVGGSVSGSTSQDQFTSGPGRIKGKLSMSNNNSKLVGTYCIEGSVNEYVEQARQAGGATLQVGTSATSGDCAYDNIKDVPMKLVIPDYPTDYAGAIELGAVSVPNGDFNYTIDIPPIEYDKETGEIVKKMYDFHLSSLTFGNDCKLIIRMQSQKSLARFFVTGPLSLTAGTTIQVAYADENATYNWSTHKWESETFEDVSLEDYKGNLLFYTTEGFEMPAMHGTAFIQGSFMSKGKIKVGSNLTLAGQFLAEAIETDNELDGKSFKYVPFDPPILKIEPEVGTEFLFPELSSWEKVPIKLDKAPVTDVKFDYCFEYLDKSSFGKPVAEPADFIINGGHPFPLCSKNEKGSVEFVTGQRTPKDDAHSVWINVKMDGVPEDEREALRLNISGLQGAVMPNGKDAGSFILYLIDGDTDPQSKDAAFTVDEDEYYVLSSKEFYFESKKHFAQEGVTIMSIPEKGFLVYRGDTLTAGGQFISMDDLGKDYLKFIAKKDDFSGEDVYTTFKFTVRDVGDPDNNIPQGTSDEYTVSITVSPVNDKPFAHDTLFTIAEHSTSGDVAEGFIQVDDVDDSRFTFAFDKKDKSYDAVNALYVIDEYGRISVKKDVVLNYETVDSILTIAVKVTDAASTTNGEGAQTVTSNITIKILDLNERPDIHDTTLAVDENAVAGTPVGKVTTDDEDVWTKFTYSLADVTEDDPVASLFTIDADGLITVAEGAKLDFEERNEYQILAIVKDNGESMGFAEEPDGEAKDLYDTALVTITINDVNEKPEFFEVEDIYNVVENFPENILFAKVLVFDPDAKDLKNLSVTLTDKDKVEDVTSAGDLFSVTVVPHTNADSSKKGFAFVTISVKNTEKLNYEALYADHFDATDKDVHFNVTLTLTDKDGESVPVDTKIRVDDVNEAPTIENAEFAVKENSDIGSTVGVMEVSDPDMVVDDPEAYNAAFRDLVYTIVEEDKDVPFVMDSNVVKVNGALDHEGTVTYTFKVAVTDKNDETLTDTATVTVTVENVNETPVLDCLEDDENCEGPFKIEENSPTGTTIHKFVVSDVDGGDELTLSLEDTLGRGAESLFDVKFNDDKTQMEVFVKDGKKLDYEEVDPSYVVRLIVTDKGLLADTLVRVIEVIDVNEAPSIKNATFSIAEDAKQGDEAGKVSASDPDSKTAEYRELVYTIVEEDKDVPFVMDSNVVKVNGALDHEGVVTYIFRVAVSDKYDPKLTDTATVTVTIDNVNETPNLDCLEDDENCDGPFKIEENSPTGTTIHNFAVSDVDAGDVLTLTLEDTLGRGAESLFDVKFNDDKTQMVVFVKDGKKLDYEKVDPSYIVRLIVTDKGLLADTLVRTIEVIDVNEAPTIENADFAIKENSDIGSTVGVMEVSDPDKVVENPEAYNAAFRDLVYTIVEEDKDVPFVMDSNEVKVNGALDHEGSATYTFKVAVSDKNDPKLTDTATVTVTIDNVNETPVLDCLEDDENCEGPFKIEENSPTGTTIHNFAVSDVDAGDVLTLTLEDTLGRGAESLFDVKFNDDKTQMVVFVKDGKKLDYEKVDPSYVVRLIVTDKGLLADTLVRTIEVIDVNEAPTIENADFAIKENSDIGSTVGVMEVSDPDKVVEDPEAYNAAFRDLVYTIVEEDKDVPFVMDSNEVKVNGALDHEGSATYTFKVAVSDKNDPKLTDTATVTVTIDNVNETPVLDCLEDDENCEGPFKIEENSPTGTPIHKFAVSDVDAGDVLTLSLEDTLGRGAESLFEVKFNDDKTQMVVFVKDGKKLDYEKVDPSYVVRLIVTDKGLLADTLVRTIEVIDVNELQVVDDATFDVDENSTVGTKVGPLVVTDPDTKNPEFRQYTYKVVDENVPFTMNADTVVVNGSIDFEGLKTYTFKVAVTDKLDPTLTDTADVTVKINDVDERPKIIVDDDDDGNDDTDSLCIAHCEVDSIDRGSHGKNIVTVGVKENSPIGTVVFEYYVYDEDADDVAKLVPTLEQISTVGTYSDGPTSNDLFEITKKKVGKDRWKIVVTVKDSIDYETLRNAQKNKDPNPQYTVAVVVTDTLDPKNPKSKALSDTIIRVIEIQDVNETPTFVVWPCIIEEHNEIGDSIGHVEHGSDVDSLSPIDKFYKDNRYELIGGDTTLFGLDTNGDVIAKVVFNCEDTTAMGERVYVCGDSTVYSIDIAYFDKNDTTLKLTRHVPITLIDVNEDPWIVTDSISVAEHVKKGTVVDTIVAKDKDLYDSVLTFTLVEDNSGCFQVSKKGVVTVKVDRCAALDYETNKVLPIKVKVTDTKNASETQTVYVKVEDVNEPPSIKDQEIHVSEDAKVNTVIGKVVATDPDIDPKYTTLNYTIISGDSTVFKINPKTGEITLKDTLDYETKKQYKIKVRVDDSEFADTATVTIKVDNVVETSTVIITKFDNPDTTINYPDTVYTNQPDGVISWRQDDDILSMDTTFKPGKNVIVISYKDPTKDKGAKDTIVVMYSNASPVVTVSGDVDAVVAENVYTIVEKTDKADTNLYVNERSKDIRVTVKDPANKTDTSFVVSLALESVEVPQKTLDAVGKIAKGGVVVDVTRKGSVRTPVNGTEIKVSYKEIIGKDTVTVSYMTDNDGEPVKVAVINAKGKVDSIEVMTVSYNTVIDGKTVTVSYQADAVTGEVLVKDSNGALMVSGASKSSNSSSSKKGNSSSSTSDGGKGRVTEGMFQITYNTEDALGNSTTISYSVDEKGNVVQNAEGDIGYSVAYTYTNVYGNSATQSVFIVLDQVGPKVEILTPEYGEIIHSNYVKVKWAVNGIEQDTLNMQGLVKGTNYVVRFFRDKAGNEASDTVLVMMKDGKDVDISVEQPVTEVSKEQVDEYYAINPPEEGQNFAVSIRNPSTGKEYETLKGIGSKTKQGSGKEPYPGASGSAHLGPTLALDVHLPTVNAVGGLATLDDLIASDGMITLEGVDAKNGTKVSVQEYVEQYCEEDFELPSDLSQVNLYDSKMIIKVWIYTNLGGFVDYYTFTQDMNDPSFTNDAGMLQMFFEQKVDKDGFVRDQDGKLYATGAYLYKVEATIRSTLRCTLPSEDYDAKTGSFGLNAKKMGDRVKSSDDLLKPFGYKRPSEK